MLRLVPRSWLPPITVLCAMALSATSAGAAPIVIGQDFEPNYECNAVLGGYTFLQNTAAEGTQYKVPVDGLITSWSFHAGAQVLANLRLKVGKVVPGPSKIEIVGDSAAGGQTAQMKKSFPAHIPVEQNDRVGVYPGGSGTCFGGPTSENGDVILTMPGNLMPTSPPTEVTYGEAPEYRIPLTVTIQPPPTVAAIAPGSGATAGNTKVTISGEDFTGTTAVTFGGLPAEAFTINSDTQITAFSPPAAAGTVDIGVTTDAGQSAAAPVDRFAYADPAPPAKPQIALPIVALPGLTGIAIPGPTGKRAAALKKCGKKRGKARAKCKKKAKEQPV